MKIFKVLLKRIFFLLVLEFHQKKLKTCSIAKRETKNYKRRRNFVMWNNKLNNKPKKKKFKWINWIEQSLKEINARKKKVFLFKEKVNEQKKYFKDHSSWIQETTNVRMLSSHFNSYFFSLLYANTSYSSLKWSLDPLSIFSLPSSLVLFLHIFFFIFVLKKGWIEKLN